MEADYPGHTLAAAFDRAASWETRLRAIHDQSSEDWQHVAARVLSSLESLVAEVRAASDRDLAEQELWLAGFQGRLLLAMAEGRPRPVVSLATQLHVSTSAVSKASTQLARRGLVERLPGLDDGRVIRVRPTREARELAAQWRLKRCIRLATWMKDLMPEDIDVLVDACRVVDWLADRVRRNPSGM